MTCGDMISAVVLWGTPWTLSVQSLWKLSSGHTANEIFIQDSLLNLSKNSNIVWHLCHNLLLPSPLPAHSDGHPLQANATRSTGLHLHPDPR